MSLIHALVVALSLVPGDQVSSWRDQLVIFNSVAPDYFPGRGTILLAGRIFTQADASEAPRAVIVNETFARKFFPDRHPVRATFVIDRFGGVENVELEIVGVVADEKPRAPRETIEPVIYAAMAQQRLTGSTVRVVKTAGQD